MSNSNGYITALGYSEKFDWLFLPSETSDVADKSINGYIQISTNLNYYSIPILGGCWYTGNIAHYFSWDFTGERTLKYRSCSSRLIYNFISIHYNLYDR